jgi:hypothetical protein
MGSSRSQLFNICKSMISCLIHWYSLSRYEISVHEVPLSDSAVKCHQVVFKLDNKCHTPTEHHNYYFGQCPSSLRFFKTQCFGNQICSTISSKRPNRVGTFPLTSEARNRPSLPILFLKKLEMMHEVQHNKHSYCFTPMHKIFRLNL